MNCGAKVLDELVRCRDCVRRCDGAGLNPLTGESVCWRPLPMVLAGEVKEVDIGRVVGDACLVLDMSTERGEGELWRFDVYGRFANELKGEWFGLDS